MEIRSITSRKVAGEPVILIHGYIYNTAAWNKNIDVLSDKFKVYAIDLWGFGYSSRLTRSQYSIKLYGKQVIGFMDVMKIKSASLTGHSMGGGITVYTTAHYPDRVEKIILVDPSVIPHAATFMIRIYKLPLVGEFISSIPGQVLLKHK